MALDLCWDGGCASFVGTGRKGRRKGSKNRSLLERIDEKEHKNELKRRNERQRVKNISHQYTRLRKALGDPHPEKKLRKQQVLNACIDYIQRLQRILDSSNADQCSETDSEISVISSCGGMSDQNTSGASCSTSSENQIAAVPTTIINRLRCEESFHSLTADELSPTPSMPSPVMDHHCTILPAQQPVPHHHLYNYGYQMMESTAVMPAAAAGPFSVTGLSPCGAAATGTYPALFEWNMSTEVELLEESFFRPTIPPNQFTPSPPMPISFAPPPPPLHHLQY